MSSLVRPMVSFSAGRRPGEEQANWQEARSPPAELLLRHA